MRKKMFPQNVLVWAMLKSVVSMATHNEVFKNKGIRTILLISQLHLS